MFPYRKYPALWISFLSACLLAFLFCLLTVPSVCKVASSPSSLGLIKSNLFKDSTLPRWLRLVSTDTNHCISLCYSSTLAGVGVGYTRGSDPQLAAPSPCSLRSPCVVLLSAANSPVCSQDCLSLTPFLMR